MEGYLLDLLIFTQKLLNCWCHFCYHYFDDFVNNALQVTITFLIKDPIDEYELISIVWYPFKRQPHKMVKHTQTIRRQAADELFERVWPFCGVDA